MPVWCTFCYEPDGNRFGNTEGSRADMKLSCAIFMFVNGGFNPKNFS